MWNGLRTRYASSASLSNNYIDKITQTSGSGANTVVEYLVLSGQEDIYYYCFVGNSIYIYSSDFRTVYIVADSTDLNMYEETFESLLARNKISKAYTFAGWYSQYYNETTETWSNLVCQTKELYRPFVSTATSNTNIVALFSEITLVSVSYNSDDASIAFDLAIDSCGNKLSVTDTENGKTLVSGWFYYSSTPTLFVSPAAHRIADTFNFTAHFENETGLNSISKTENFDSTKLLTFLAKNGEKYEKTTYDKVSLTNANYLIINLPEFMKNIETSNGLSTVELELDFEKVVLTYFNIGGFFNKDSGITGAINNEFYLYSYNNQTNEIENILVYAKVDATGTINYSKNSSINGYTPTYRDSANNENLRSV